MNLPLIEQLGLLERLELVVQRGPVEELESQRGSEVEVRQVGGAAIGRVVIDEGELRKRMNLVVFGPRFLVILVS